jgi:tetratricopeptide (TPR) repeat protein
MRTFMDSEIAQCLAFLAKSKILIIDDELGARLALRNSLVRFGASLSHIKIASNLAQAKMEIERHAPVLIFCEYLLEDGFGPDLSMANANCIFILNTAENSKACLAHAAMKGIDHFLFKPYDRTHLHELLTAAILKRVNPTPANRLLDLGRVNLRAGLSEDALKLFLEAKRINQASAETCALIGSTLEELNRSSEEVEAIFSEGLLSSPAHFSCLSGLYSSSRKNNNSNAAYQYLKKIVLNYPESSERTIEAISLALQTRNYQDLAVYFEIFKSIKLKPFALESALASAFSVVGNLYLSQNRRSLAILHFQRAVEISSNKEKYIEYVCTHLSAAGMTSDADDFYALFFEEIGTSKQSTA